MSDDLIKSNPWLNEFSPISEDSIVLAPEDIDRATEISQRSRHPEKRWQIYLSALSLVGFEHWLEQKIPKAKISTNECTILEPPSASTSTAICNLNVNGFKICLVEVGSFLSETLFIPKATIDSIDLAAHFYVPITVDEESNVISIHGFLRQDTIQPTMLSSESTGFYALSIAQFDPNLDRLLLLLECLEPQAISLPKKAVETRTLDRILVKPPVKFKHWVQQQWNELIEIDWKLITSEKSLAGAMRSSRSDVISASEIDLILKSLQQSGVRTTNKHQRGIGKDFEYAGLALRLYIVSATNSASSPVDENSMIFILKFQNGENLPPGLLFQVSDAEKVLEERTIESEEESDFIYCQAFGIPGEQFCITLQLNQTAALTLEPIEL